MRYHEITEKKDELVLPPIEVGDEVMVGKFKNRKAIVKSFTQDDHNQPVLKTTKGDQKLFKPRLSKLMVDEGRDSNMGGYTEAQAREIGDCAIVAISHIVGKSWQDVWDVAKPYFSRYGIGAAGDIHVLKHFGYREDGYYKMPWMTTSMTVKQAEEWLQSNDPEVKLHCMIYVDRMPHAIAFVDGKFHNVLGAYKSKIRLCYECKKI